MVKLTITFTPILNDGTFVVVRFIARRMKKDRSVFLIHHSFLFLRMRWVLVGFLIKSQDPFEDSNRRNVKSFDMLLRRALIRVLNLTLSKEYDCLNDINLSDNCG